MRTGKMAESILKRSVLKQLNNSQAVCDRRYGMDCAILPVGGTAYTVVNAVPGFEDSPEKLVISAVNNLAAAGAVPSAMLVSAVLPPDYEEPSLKADMKHLAREARVHGMEIIGGHTQVSASVMRPVYSVTGIGSRSFSELSGEIGADLLTPGMDLVMTGWIALGGTAALVRRYETELSQRFPLLLLDEARAFEKLMCVEEQARACTHFGAAVMHDLSQGGIFCGLREMAERAGVGLEVDLKKIPVRQETIELCEYFDINPYCFYSAGALLAGTQQAEALVSELSGQGIPAAVIGRVTDGNDRIIRNGEEIRYLDRPQQEEWYRRFPEQG